MIVVDWNDMAAGGRLKNRKVRLTIGVFDGLHLGHRRLMRGVVEGPGDVLPLVITPSQKIARLDTLGIGAVVLIDFSSEMSNLSGEAFIALLKENLAIEKIVVGSNFRFGRGREAGPGDLKEMLSDTGTDVQVTEPVLWGDKVVSSSRIRKTIQEASFSEAHAMLAAAYAIDLRGIHADRIGAHAVRVGGNDLKQVLPRVGRYPVTCQGQAGLATGEVEIRETCLIVDSPVADTATSIIFEHAT